MTSALGLVITALAFSHLAEGCPQTRIVRVENPCPFEGCYLGDWEVASDVPIHAEPSAGAREIDVLLVGDSLEYREGFSITATGCLYLFTGRRWFADLPSGYVEVLDYQGEGNSRLMQHGREFVAQVPRALGEWPFDLAVLRPAHDEWWVRVRRTASGAEGWVLMAYDGGLRAGDAFR